MMYTNVTPYTRPDEFFDQPLQEVITLHPSPVLSSLQDCIIE